MSIEYTVLADGRWMQHTSYRLAYERDCDGCGEPLPRYGVIVITDRSGSEHGVAHKDCVGVAIELMEEEGY